MTKLKFSTVFPLFFTLLLIFYIFFLPSSAADAASAGLKSCVDIIPYLFPYIAIAGFISSSDIGNAISKMLAPVMPLFGLPGCLATPAALGLISGFPISAVSADQVCKSKNCTSEQAGRLICFSSNPSPSFIIALTGGAILGNVKYGFIFYIFQCISFFVSGTLFNFFRDKENYFEKKSNLQKNYQSYSQLFTRSVSNAVSSIIIICGFIIFFSFISGFVTEFFPFETLIKRKEYIDIAKVLIKGILEIGSGISYAEILPMNTRIFAVAVILGFGSLSAFFQISGLAEECKVPFFRYLIAKLINIFFLLLASFVIIYFFE